MCARSPLVAHIQQPSLALASTVTTHGAGLQHEGAGPREYSSAVPEGALFAGVSNPPVAIVTLTVQYPIQRWCHPRLKAHLPALETDFGSDDSR